MNCVNSITAICALFLSCALCPCSAQQVESNSQGQRRISSSDVELLDALIRDHHVRPFWKTPEADYRQVLDAAKATLESSDQTREQSLVELMKIVACLQDGHSMMAYESRDQLFGYLPLTTEWFGDELRILQTTEPHRKLLGSRIVAFDETPLAEVARRLKTVVPHANEHRFTKMSPYYAQLPGLLYGLGITASPDGVRLQVKFGRGQSESVWIERMSAEQYEKAVFVSYDDQQDSLPLYRQNTRDPYWYCYLAAEKIFYVGYNRIASDDDKPIWSWAPAMWKEVDKLDVEKIVLDMRNNGGGGLQFCFPIIEGIVDRPRLNQRGKLFVLTGYKTFSAAIGALEELEQRTAAIIVGTPPSDHPASPGDSDPFELGDTGIKFNLSTVFHDTVFPDDRRTAIGLDYRVPTTWEDFQSKRDPLMQFVSELDQEAVPKPIAELPGATGGRYLYSPDVTMTIEQQNGQWFLQLGNALRTPVYELDENNTERTFGTEVNGLTVEVQEDDQILLSFPDGKTRVCARRGDDNFSPVELVYRERFDAALQVYRSWLDDDQLKSLVNDQKLADRAMHTFYDLRSKLGSRGAKRFSGAFLDIAVILFPDESSTSRMMMRYYKSP